MPTSLPTVGTIRLGEKNIDNFEQSTALIINRVEVSLSLITLLLPSILLVLAHVSW